jgi:hypothetical protein
VARRYNERSSDESLSCWLKQEFEDRSAIASGPVKVMLHLMFILVSLFAVQFYITDLIKVDFSIVG